jgi:hypothetical protein
VKITTWLLFALLSAMILSKSESAFAQTDTESSQAFVQSFYDWYTPLSLKEHSLPAIDITLSERQNLFSHELYMSLRADSIARKKDPGFIVGLDFDPFLATQDPCEKDEVGKAILEGDKYIVEVYEVCEGKKRTAPNVEVELSKKDGQWIIDNFYYPPFGTSEKDLLSKLELLKKEREKSQKQ